MRFRRREELPPVAEGASDEERFVWHLVGEAQAQRALAAGDGDMHVVKALGMLALDGATILGLTAAKSSLPRLWWVAVIALALCVPFFLFTIADGRFRLGPALAGFYAAQRRAGSLQAGVQLLSRLSGDMAVNRRAMALRSAAFTIGLVCFVAGILFTATFLARTSLIG